MSFVNLNYNERKMLIDGIIESDYRYLEKLLVRKGNLVNELTALDIMIKKKLAEIQGMELQQQMMQALQ